jgi:hypothetical protein
MKSGALLRVERPSFSLDKGTAVMYKTYGSSEGK